MSKAAEWVNRTSITRLALSETLSKLKDIEANQRGFLLSKDSSFLNHYTASTERFHTHMVNLHLLLTNNTALTAQADTLGKLVDHRLHLIQKVLVENDDHAISDKVFKLEFAPGKEAMKAIEARLNLMDRMLEQLLQERITASKQFNIATPLYAATLSLLALLIIIIAYYHLNRQLKLSKNYIQQSRASEQKAKKANFLFETSEQITNSGSWEYNFAQNKMEFSDNLFRLYGYESNTFEPGVFDFMPQIDEEGRKDLLGKLANDRITGQVSTSYFWITRKDGQRRYFQCISRFSTNEKGEDIVTGTSQDITETHLLKQESEFRARFIGLVAENNVDMLAAFDKELRITFWNKAHEEIFGLSKQDVIGKKITEAFPYLKNDIKTTYLQAALKGKETIRQEFTYFKNQRIGEFSIIPLKNEAGIIEGVLTNIHDMTQIKQAERLLKESNMRFEHAEKASNMGSFFLNLTTNEASISNNLFRLFGHEPQSFEPSLENFFKNRVHPDDKAIVIESHRKFMNSRELGTLFYRVFRNDGKIMHVKDSSIAIENERGEQVIFGSLLDITEETLLKQQLEERNQLIETLIENSADMIEVIDTQMFYTVWNKANEQQFGLSKDEVLGRKITDVFPSLMEDKRMEYIKAGLEGKATYRIEQPYLNGQKTGDFSYIPLHNAAGSIIGLLIMAHDITERIKAGEKLKKVNTELFYRNQALQEAYSFNRHITDLAPNGIYVYDKTKGHNVFTNKKAVELHGYTEGELEEMGADILARLIHPEDLPVIFERLKCFETATDKDVVELEYRMRNKDGQYRYIIARESIFKRNKNGEPEQFIGVSIDVTDLKMVEKELKEKNLTLQQRNEELASFNYIASHDLQEPLRKIQTFGNFLEETEKGLSEDGKSSLKRMQLAAARMRNLINDLLSFSRITMVQEELNQVDLNEVLKGAKSLLRASINEKGARIVACELPVIQGVAFQLQQLFENVIGNSVKYCKPGIPPVVTITNREVTDTEVEDLGLQPGWVYQCISIQDNGIGFEQQYADKIFELFQRLHTKSEYPGTGLGLAICKKIIQNHGGHIQASSEPGAGSTFEIFLPVVKELETV